MELIPIALRKTAQGFNVLRFEAVTDETFVGSGNVRTLTIHTVGADTYPTTESAWAAVENYRKCHPHFYPTSIVFQDGEETLKLTVYRLEGELHFVEHTSVISE